MIRVPGLNASVVELISRPADALLSRHAAAQRQLVSMQQSKRCSPQRPVRRACVVTSGFALWNDAGQLLGELAQHGSVECVTINNSSPTQASDLRLARAADGCDMVITANVGRADRPGTVANEVPWITWVTGTTVPARVASAPDDRLILADATLQIAATHAGWPDASVSIAREPWHERPAPELPCDSKPHGRDARATHSIIVDLPAITLPPAIDEMSSLRLVWELIERELTGCALRERGTVESFILKCADQVGVPREGFPIATFRDGLVLPLFARELALELALHGIDFTIHGHGWDNFPTLASRWRGPVTSAETFAACLRSSSAILDVHPGVSTHPSRRTGLPLLSPWGRPLKNAMTRLPPSGRVAGALTMSTILNAL
jgi:hypothetical protein